MTADPRSSNLHEFLRFEDELPGLKVTCLVANVDFIREHPQAIHDFLKALLLEHRKVADDAQYLVELQDLYVPPETRPNSDVVSDIAESLAPFYPVNGGMTTDALTYTIGFFSELGTLSPDLSADDVADLSILSSVLEEIGEE
jgi:ABC-type nitrate/sulfonate/bicarbonate transport system substrate-binding protein